ncbi:MAG: hypothetical protein U0169_16090 [Polyangiaceae bacterium]
MILPAFVFPVAGCDAETKRDATALVGAVDRYRRASNEEKPSRVDPIAAVVVHDPELVATKATCLEAAQSFARGLAKKRDVEKALHRIETKELASDSAEAAALPGTLDEAAKLVETGHAAMGRCEERTDLLRKKYGL